MNVELLWSFGICLGLGTMLMAQSLTPATGSSGQAARVASFAELDRRGRAGESLSVVFFGGSLTWGANASDPQRTSYRARMAEYLWQRYPKAPITFHDAAIGGTGSKLGVFRLQRDVLSRKPDIVFYDFTANDDLFSDDPSTLDSYETILRTMVEQGVVVQQMFLGFKFNFGTNWAPRKLLRREAHLKLAAAYHTGVGDCFPLIQERLTSEASNIDQLWPLDGAHPDDPGYALFFEAGRLGFEQAVAQGRVCMVPDKPVFSTTYANHRRITLVDQPVPQGWKRERTYRTSMWFDGLSSRWMGDVLACDAKEAENVQPIRVEFEGTFVGLLGEADDNALPFRVRVDGQPVTHKPNAKAEPTDVWTWDTKKLGAGRLLTWKAVTDKLAPGRHVVEIVPMFDGASSKSQLRIESVCVAGASQ